MRYLLDGQETERILFRKIRTSDFNDWLVFFKNPETSTHWIESVESPELECEKWYTKQFFRYNNNLGGMNALIEKATGHLIGHCGLLVQTVDNITELEIGYSLLPAYWNMGFATEAARKCKHYAFEKNLAASLISIIGVTNTPSENVARKNGMWLDKKTIYKNNAVNIFRLNRSDWEKDQ